MKKLKLNLDELKIESFETSGQIIKEGTIVGQATGTSPVCGVTCEDGCDPVSNATCTGSTCVATCVNTCPNTCAYTCPNTCDASCNGTCYNTCGPETCDLSPSCNFTAACSPCA